MQHFTTYCRSSSGDSVNLLSGTLSITMVGSEWCITNLTYGRWILIQSIVGINRRANLSQQRAKKVVSDSAGLVDFAIRLVVFVLNLPDGRIVINTANQKGFWG